MHVQHLVPDKANVETFALRSADHGSLEDLLARCLETMGHVPEVLVAGVAGRPRPNGDVRVTNQPDWPVFRRDRFAAEHGIRIEIVNDMVATVAGLSELGEAGYRELTPGTSTTAPARLVVAIGTGVGVGYLDAAGRPHGTEAGHIPWQPVAAREYDYLCWLRTRRPGVPISVEDSIAGRRGFDHLYDFLAGAPAPAPRTLSATVARFRRQGQGIGPLLTAEALKGDPFSMEVMWLFGRVLGQFLRSMALATMSQGGSIWLGGSVLQSGLAEHLVSRGSLLEAFRGAGAQHADLMEQIPMFLVCDREVAVKGALALSRTMAAG